MLCSGSERYGEQLGRASSDVGNLPQTLRFLLLSSHHPAEQLPESAALLLAEGNIDIAESLWQFACKLIGTAVCGLLYASVLGPILFSFERDFEVNE